MSSFREFIKTAAPLNHPSSNQKGTLRWKIGAKFMRPDDHSNGGKILTVKEIRKVENTLRIVAVEDGLWTYSTSCTLVG